MNRWLRGLLWTPMVLAGTVIVLWTGLEIAAVVSVLWDLYGPEHIADCECGITIPELIRTALLGLAGIDLPALAFLSIYYLLAIRRWPWRKRAGRADIKPAPPPITSP